MNIAGSSATLSDIQWGRHIIVLAIINLIFAALRKQSLTILTYAITAVIAGLTLNLVNGALYHQEFHSFTPVHLKAGFYILIVGTVLMVLSHLAFIARKKKTKQ